MIGEAQKIGNKIVIDLKWQDNTYNFVFSRFHLEKDGLKAFCEVKNENDIFYGRVNLESRKSKNEFVKYWSEKMLLLEKENLFIMTQIFDELCDKVRTCYFTGENVEIITYTIDDLGVEEQIKPETLIEPFIYKNQINMLYGEGGSFKSLFSLYLSKLILDQNPDMNILFLNYETDRNEIERRVRLLKIPKIWHRYCSIPITEEVEVIAEIIKEKNIQLVIIDSIGVAISNFPLNDPQSATALFASIREFKTTTLLIGHQPKTGNDYPFGSVYFYNLARNVWQTNAYHLSQYENYLVLVHKKDNLSSLKKPQAYKVLIDDFSIEFQPTKLTNIPEATEFMPKYLVVYQYLQDNPNKTIKEIAQDLKDFDLTERRIRSILNKYKKLFVKTEDDKWSVTEHRVIN